MSETQQLATAARMFGRLFVRELDRATLDEFSRPDVRQALAELGVPLPDDTTLDELAQQWLEGVLHPRHASPPVHSLFRGGNYSGDPAVAVRRIAAAGGLALAPGARNAPVDHIGCILLLWADLIDERPDLARILATEHMRWAERALQPLAAADGAFYPAIARATIALLAQLADAAHADAPPTAHSSTPTSPSNQGDLS